jgi:hypothetical protein
LLKMKRSPIHAMTRHSAKARPPLPLPRRELMETGVSGGHCEVDRPTAEYEREGGSVLSRI